MSTEERVAVTPELDRVAIKACVKELFEKPPFLLRNKKLFLTNLLTRFSALQEPHHRPKGRVRMKFLSAADLISLERITVAYMR